MTWKSHRGSISRRRESSAVRIAADGKEDEVHGGTIASFFFLSTSDNRWLQGRMGVEGDEAARGWWTQQGEQAVGFGRAVGGKAMVELEILEGGGSG